MKTIFYIFAPLLTIGIALGALWNPLLLWWYVLVGPLVVIGTIDLLQKKHAIRRNYPIIGHFRYMLEGVRPEIMQYFVETDTEGRPLNRIWRTMIYQRAKNVRDTTPFGTQSNVYETGYEWMEHSMYPVSASEIWADPRVFIGGPHCKKPYLASVLNISAMSYGSLSKNAIMALNWGAHKGGFYHNTGEGAISPWHLKYGGDLVWQIGTGYFGCRTEDGNFHPEKFREKAALEQVKMIEIKLSQGAKPGHGGILPAAKNTEEIASIRGVEPYTDVHSPPMHSAFKDSVGLMKFVQQLRDLSGGKPVGFKLCLGSREEFDEILQAMITTGIKPDFITVDGGEGGTGAAPVEFSNSLGTPMRDALHYINNQLVGYDLKKDIRIIASGKIISGFHISRALAMGADLCNSARAMMISIGCIQALKCNSNECPTGVATQNAKLYSGLDVASKADRAASFHRNTMESFVHLMAACGFRGPEEIKRKHIHRRVSMNATMTYEELYPSVETGQFLQVGVNGQ
jgi:glutamate synthase domain-containing protein 2